MIDPQRLEALIQELKPDAPVDDRFVERLRSKLLDRASVRHHFSFMNFLTAKNRYLVPGLAVLALAVVGTVALQSKRPQTASTPAGITRVKSNAFGRLALNAPSGSVESAAQGMAATSGGTADLAAPAPAALPPMAGGGAGTVSTGMAVEGKMIAPGEPGSWTPIIYQYRYAGEAIEGLKDQVDVYRRVKGAAGSGPIAALQELSRGLLDLSKAKDGAVQSFTIAEKRDQGYVFNVELQEGTVNVYQNTKWPSPLLNCQSQECYEQNRLKEKDMLSNEEAISIADGFLSEYGISKTDYGQPIVGDQWRVQYMAMAAESRPSFWFPDAVMVVYPTLIDGQVAYDEGGNPYGLNVNVDIRAKRASNVWNLVARNYESSAYAAETDAKRLISIAEKTDAWYGDAVPEGAKTVLVELDTPTIAFVRAWQQASDNSGQELLVPALVFPLKNAPKDLWRQNVIVPLAKDLLDQNGAGGRPVPMGVPMMK